AVAQGRDAALAMIRFLNGEELTAVSADFLVEKQVTADDFCHYEKKPRVQPNCLPAEERRNNFEQVAEIMLEEQAITEAKRCLECGCADYFECKLIKYANDYKVEPQRLEGDKHEKLPIEQHPFMKRDMNKCILCSLCVRVCDELMGRTALGLVNRGFDTVIKPEFGVSLLDSDCISCGQCIAVCPTGAIVEHNQGIKNVPLQVEQTRTVCPYCDLGCTLLVEHRGSLVSKVVPEEGSLLCSCGRFGWQDSGAKRLTEPMIRKNGRLEKVSWQEAIEYTAGIALDLHTQFGDNSSGVVISPAYTMEEAAAAAHIAHNGLGTEIAGSFAADPKKNLVSMLGADLYQNNLDELTDTDLIIMLGSFNNNQIAAVKARQAAQDGAQLIIISQENSIADDKAVIKVSPRENNTSLLKQLLAAAMQRKNYANSFAGGEELERQLSTVVVGEEVSTIEAMYASAQKAMIIIDGGTVSSEAINFMTALALMTGHAGAPANGIIVINNGANSQGIIKAGFTTGREELLQKIKQGIIKGIFILEEDPVGAGIISETELNKAGKIIVLDAFMTPTAATADVILPGAVGLEKAGTCTGADGKVRIMESRLTPPSGMNNIAILNELARAMQLNPGVANHTDEITSSKIDLFRNINLNDDVTMFNQIEIMDYALRKFIEYKQIKQIK
ncbi:MAG: molybdopterin-dependent oxidoreductase, partial [Syntrophomonadaceae bacterium]|nr:molybdopterin-dependent oxidoreductase [Syntrophomonadaceae bacterium]